MDGFGSITWWGFSPALDLQGNDMTKDLNVLLVGAGDCRHILKTISNSCCRRNDNRRLNFYVLENNLELYARNLLLLCLALEPQSRLGLQEKTEVFLELYGNSLVRQQSMEYVQKRANLFIKMVTDFDFLEEKLPLIDFSNLKFKERDFLEGIFKFWRNPDKSLFDISKCWDLRVRQHLGPRYDAIPNVFDWDYSMKLTEKGADIIYSKDYSHWRGTGVAYDVREATYDVPNKTLASGMLFKHEGEQIARRGYWGDILVSPYITFGIESEEKSFFKKSNKQYTKSAQHVAEFNVLSMLHQIVHGERYELPVETTEDSQKSGSATLQEITEEDEEEEKEEAAEPTAIQKDLQNPLDLDYEAIPVDNAKVFMLPLNSAGDLYKKSKFQRKFNCVYISNSMVHLLTPELVQTFTDDAELVLETSKFMLDLKEEQHQTFIQKISGMARGVGCKVAAPCSKDDCFARFTFSREADGTS